MPRLADNGVMRPFFTIGHSTRTIEEFADLLRHAGVQLVADVRAIPRSRTNPQYNNDVLPAELTVFQVGYADLPTLGGRRGRTHDVPAEVNAFWINRSFHNYADYAMGAAFRSGLAELRELGHARCCAIMCAEAVWWRCHRRIVADYLIAAGETVFHIMGPGHVDAAERTTAARPGPAGALIYPPS